ncbi:NAD(+) synthase [Patescibacteria group bacterium]
MFLRPIEEVIAYHVGRIRAWGNPDNAFLALSGGADSALVAALLVEAFGKDRVVTMFRNIRSKIEHKEDAREVAGVLGVRFLNMDGNFAYDDILRQAKSEMERNGDTFYDEGSEEAKNRPNFQGGFESCKSRLTTPMAGLFSKFYMARIYGTGNIEEDLIIRYFDKFGDGAVDYCPIVGLTKMEVWQMLLYFAEKYNAEVFRRIAYKTPSADLQANGDVHNDESQLTSLAKAQGFDIQLSYGTPEKEGNLAWACKEEVRNRSVTVIDNALEYGAYSEKEIQLLKFMASEECKTRHKDFGLPGITRQELMKAGLVD